jgi:hypothetical protein
MYPDSDRGSGDSPNGKVAPANTWPAMRQPPNICHKQLKTDDTSIGNSNKGIDEIKDIEIPSRKLLSVGGASPV